MSGLISYNFNSLNGLGGNLQAEFGRLEELATQLRQQVQSLDSSWSSPEAKVAYTSAQANWDRIFAQSREQLLGLRQGVQKASNSMSDVDSSLGKGFTGIF